ncbi:MAG: hypothetical protein C0483_18410 [Pirellula sp.]|nr:hypothetical protein [Pirellula sp.]
MNVLTDEQIKSNIQQNIDRLLKIRHWTQKELASRAQVRESVLSDVKLGKSVPGLSIALRIAEALDITVDRLASDPPKENSKRSA